MALAWIFQFRIIVKINSANEQGICHLEEPVIAPTRDVSVLPVPGDALELGVVGDGDLLAEVDEHPGGGLLAGEW